MASGPGTLPVGRYFGALFALLVVLYGIVFWPHQSHTPKLGLDLEGGAQVILKAQTTEGGKKVTKSALDQARQIIDNRVNGLGVSSAEVVTEGSDRIVVSVPGASADDISTIGGTALLQFRPLLTQAVPVSSPSPSATPSASASATGTAKASSTAGASSSATANGSASPTATPTATASPAAATSAAAAASASPKASASPSSSVPANSPPVDQWAKLGFTPPTTPDAVAALTGDQATKLQQYLTDWSCDENVKPVDNPAKPIITCNQDGTEKYLLGPVIVKGTQVKTAQATGPGSTQGQLDWRVVVDLKSDGQRAWADYTSKHNEQSDSGAIGNTVADTLDSRVIVASTIQSTITGRTEISGNFTQKSATDLANALKYGALPLNFTQQAATTVSPTLGTDQLKAGMLAGGIGLLLVVIYSLLYYRALGFVTIASLLVSGGLTYAMLVILGEHIGFTLTLAGIAGFIVAVGITADSFVVFFERIKDEVHEGRTSRVAIPRAWERARRTIISADTVSLLAAVILYYFAAGDVKGFAFTLGLSTILDLIVVFLFTHPLVSLFSRSAAFGSARFTGLNHVREQLPARRREPVAVGVGAGSGSGSQAGAADEDSSGPALPAADSRAEAGAEQVGPTERASASGAPTASDQDRDSADRPPAPGTHPAAGTTAAERAAARRGLKRDQSSPDAKDSDT